MPKKILIVEDEANIRELLRLYLEREGYIVIEAENGVEGIKKWKSEKPDMLLLDVMMPVMDGWAVCKEIRAESDVPIIMLTAKGETADRVSGLEMGADDYIVKPFLMKELVLRVTAVLKRTYQTSGADSSFTLSGKTIDFETASVNSDSGEVRLTAKEFILLKKLFAHKNKIVTNDALCLAAWGDDYYGYENTLMVHIRRLREKIEQNPGKPRHLITVKGIGYKLVISDE